MTHPREHSLGDVVLRTDERRVVSVSSLAESAHQQQQGAGVTAVTLVYQKLGLAGRLFVSGTTQSDQSSRKELGMSQQHNSTHGSCIRGTRAILARGSPRKIPPTLFA